MHARSLMAGCALAAALAWNGTAGAGAADYAFEPVTQSLTMGDGVTVAVRLVHKPSGNAVPDAVIFRTRMDMAPDAMAEMESPLDPLPSGQPGVYAFRTDLGMEGRYLLSIAAKVQGEPETVIGKIVFTAKK
jgi:hypothetical protein